MNKRKKYDEEKKVICEIVQRKIGKINVNLKKYAEEIGVRYEWLRIVIAKNGVGLSNENIKFVGDSITFYESRKKDISFLDR
jgi:butyrate kinase